MRMVTALAASASAKVRSAAALVTASMFGEELRVLRIWRVRR
jgi:hypothetical protein